MSSINKFFLTRKIKIDMIVLSIIILLPFVFFSFKLAPETQIWENKFFRIDFGDFYGSAKYFLWYFLTKILTLMILSIWFLTCKYNWRYVLFIPIIVELYKLYALFKVIDLGYDYRPNILYTILISIPFLIILLLISSAIGYYNYSKPNSYIINDEINKQMKNLSKFDVNNYKTVKKELLELLNDKQNIPRKEYLIKLIELRDKITE